MKHVFWLLIPAMVAIILVASTGIFGESSTIREALPPKSIEILDHQPHSMLRDQ